MGSLGQGLSCARHVVHFSSNLMRTPNGVAILEHSGSLEGHSATLSNSRGYFENGL